MKRRRGRPTKANERQTAAETQAAYRRGLKERDLKEVTVIVPTADDDRVRRFARELRKAAGKALPGDE